MTSENQHMDKSKLSPTSVDSTGQMRGWFKLIETIRKTEPPSNSSTPISININGHQSHSPEPIHFDEIFPPESPSTEAFEDIPTYTTPPTPKSTSSKRSSSRHKKITIRKSSRSKDFSSINSTTIDEENISLRKRQSFDSSLNSISIIPIATDLQSLPGHNEDELRDHRYLDYADVNTLSIHLHSCLHIDKKFSSSIKQQFFKTRHNILNKIFKIDYFKKSQKLSDTKKDESIKTDISSTSSTSFKIDWSVNRRSSSTHRYEPKNIFHILQLNPKKQIFLPTKTNFEEKLSGEEQINLHYEHMQKLLVRTYYPHFHIAVQRGHYFGSKSKLFMKQNNLPIIINPRSPTDIDDTMTIKLNSPISTFEHDSRKRGRRLKHKHNREKPRAITSIERRVSEEIPAVVILTSPPTEKEVNNNTIINRKRKPSITIHSQVSETKKKKIILPLSPEIITNESQDLSYSDSDDDILPDELPKQNFIKNGLRSNYYKTNNEIDSKLTNSKSRLSRRQQSTSGSLPPFYTAIFQSEENRSSYIDYKLPYDIYWLNQKSGNTISSPTELVSPPKKKKSSESKQKQPLPNKRIIRNISIDPSIQHHLLSPTKKHHLNKNIIKMEELTEDEKQIVSQSFIFLKRNLRRIKEQNEFKDKNNNQQKQHNDHPLSPLFFAQNYFHRNSSEQRHHTEILSHKDLLNVFYNHIRRSHFGKTGQYYLELIDKTCYYAQLAQLTLILNDMFELLLNFKCYNSDIHPSNALKKCPLKRLFPMYYEIISKPIDLSIIRNKLDNGEYFSYESFEHDFLLLFTNAITYCGEDSDVGRAVNELQRYFTDILKVHYELTINLFNNINDQNQNERNLDIFKDFLTCFHEKEVIDGQVRETMYDIIYDLDNTQPIVYKTVTPTTTSTHRTTKNTCTNDSIIHCRCTSVYDETLLIQCYACQLWQHAACVTVTDTSRPYFCFECHPLCEQNPSDCLKTNVCIPDVNQSSYLTITRSDGLSVRVNESYFILKQEEVDKQSISPFSTSYDIFCIERLWIDENNIVRASGFYYLRPYETFHEVNRKFFPNEVFRFPSTSDSIELTSIIRPCYVLDPGTFCKGKPICEYGSRILSTDLFICEYRVDKLARTFTRLPKSKHIGINTKSYCFDNYIEKLSIKRDYQPHQKEYYQQTTRRRSTIHSSKLTGKQLEEKSSHIDGIIEKIYCHYHHPNLIPHETKVSPDQFFQQPTINETNTNRGSKRLRNKNHISSPIVTKKRCTHSISSNDNLIETTSDTIISLLLDELIQAISSPLA
ncbi:hypothetical protein I4U23_026012 [Adineta vaga]|nr:hypothetical protein I4U23_026012 [Adineta vaga]